MTTHDARQFVEAAAMDCYKMVIDSCRLLDASRMQLSKSMSSAALFVTHDTVVRRKLAALREKQEE